MAKLRLLTAACIFLTQCLCAQGYRVQYRGADGAAARAGLDTVFASRTEASSYVAGLAAALHSKGFVAASVDSVSFDSTAALVQLYLGDAYRWARLRTSPAHQLLLQGLRIDLDKARGGLYFSQLQGWQQKILDHLEATGRPFGRVFLDSIAIDSSEVSAFLHIDEGPTYRIDSIRVYGDVKVSNRFLQQYLDLPDGSLYNKKKLAGIGKKLAELPYLQEERPSDLSLLGTGSVLNLYLKPRRSSQANALIGFLPNSQRRSGERKLLLTVDANVLLRNALGGGETIGLVWQQLQQGSPRLNLLFDHPYVFRSPFGVNFQLDMYRLDSVFLNLNMNLGVAYRVDARQTASVFVQRRQTIVNGYNTAAILQSRRLPPEIDVASVNLGVGFQRNTTDYRFNPRRGSDLSLTASAGTKQIKKANQILELKDPADPSFRFESLYDTLQLKAYQFRLVAALARYLPLGRQSTVKLGAHAGWFGSANYFRNELFQIGGYRLLRGFDEESQFVSRYLIGTTEYRYLLGQNSAFFLFADGGWARHLSETKPNYYYLGTGLGLSFETKAGIINLAWAVGKRDDLPFNLRQSKLHVGFASYF